MPVVAARTITADLRFSPGHHRRPTMTRFRASIRPSLDEMIFIVGAPRSGTTFLGEVVAAVPEFSYHFEPVITKAAAPYVFTGAWDHERAGAFYRRAYRWLGRFRLDGDLRQVDKTPRNAMILPFLAAAFPDAQFVHLIRDGRDVAHSWSRRPWLAPEGAAIGRHEPGGYRHGPFARFWVEPNRVGEFESTSTAHRCAWGWRRHVTAARRAGARLSPDRYLEIRYEDLVSDPERIGGRLLDFLGVPEGSRAGARATLARARPDAGGGWRVDLEQRDLDLVMAEIGGLLAELGY